MILRACDGLKPQPAMSASRRSTSNSERESGGKMGSLLCGMGLEVFHGIFQRHRNVGGDEDGIIFHPLALTHEAAVGALECGDAIDEGDAPIMTAALRVDDDGLAIDAE